MQEQTVSAYVMISTGISCRRRLLPGSCMGVHRSIKHIGIHLCVLQLHLHELLQLMEA